MPSKNFRWRRIGKPRVKCARGSVRTKRIGRTGKLLRVCCPRGKWKPRVARCKVSMRGYEIGTRK